MTTHTAPEAQTRRRLFVGASALALALTTLHASPARAQQIVPPPVPAGIAVPDGHELFLGARAAGTQNYICLPAADRFAWTLVTPQATLFDELDAQVTTHFLSPNPVEGGTPRATWLHSLDTSAVWARAIASYAGEDFVAPGAIPWLLLEAEGGLPGPAGGDTLAPTTYLQRVNTTGGRAPATGCSRKKDVGSRAFVPYTADYFFFRATS